jgi:prepilin-type processing-associated H-X9-DG protein
MKFKLSAASDNFPPPAILPAGECAFSRVDLLALVFLVVLLGAWLVVTHVGAIGRQVRCASNLSALGRAMHNYANEHDGSLPAATLSWGGKQSSWDLKLLPYLMPGLAKANSGELFADAPRWIRCPSDISGNATQGRTPRSYAMSGNDMSPSHWPLGPESATGVGLVWNESTATSLVGPDVIPEELPGLKLPIVSAPARTALLTELIDPNNVMGTIQTATVFNAFQQQAFFNVKTNFDYCHRGEFNYLMVDGHVERLSALQAGSLGGGGGIWSIKKGN